MEFKFGKKFGEKHIDEFINKFYLNYKSASSEGYIFNLEDVEWISNQALLLLTSVCTNLYEKGIKFKFIFCEINDSSSPEFRRKIVNVINLWDNWKLYRTVPDPIKWSEYFKFKNSNQTFNISLLDSLKAQLNIKVDDNLYNRIRITPFIKLEKVDDYIDEKIIQDHIKPIFKLNDTVSKELSVSQSSHPFINNTLSHIITKELYENFLDHAGISIFKNDNEFAFMSLSLRKSLLKYDYRILSKNFNEEELDISKEFFSLKSNFINKAIVEYSFLDFGKGITETLKANFISKNSDKNIDDNEILKFAFSHYSSRHPIKKYDAIDDDVILPRGLFDVLTVVKRYSGLIIIRSNYGKILFNFSENNKDEDVKVFGTGDQFFPGTFITIYLPSFDQETVKFDSSAIKPIFKNIKNKIPKSRYINLIEIYNKIDQFKKENLYSKLVENLKIALENNSDNIFINYISFKGCTDERLNKLSIFFLLSDYDININNSAIIFNPPEKNFITGVKNQILNLSLTIKDYVLHPIPLIYSEDDIDWLGIYDEKDKKKLSDFFYEGMIQSVDDFNMPNNIIGNLQFQEGDKNLYSLLSHVDVEAVLEKQFIEEILARNNCIRKDGLYFCNGNYYQNEFVQLLELLNNYEDCNSLVENLLKKIGSISPDVHFIAITSSSHKILKAMINIKSIDIDRCLFLDSYLTFENDIKTKGIRPNTDYILVGDVLSGGSLAKRVEKILKEKNSNLKIIAVLINTIDDEFLNSKELVRKFNDEICFVVKYPVKKYKRQDINILDLKNVIRINPYTNLPSIFSDKYTLKESIVFADNNIDFLNYINHDNIQINYKIFNNLVHPYFFDLKKIISEENLLIENNPSKSFLNYIFNSYLKDKLLLDKEFTIFYPKGSDIGILDFNLLSNKILKNHSVKIFELERFNINEGWKFPHTTDSYGKIIGRKNVLILDDGSCSGDSLLQMVNELSYFAPSKINVLSLIGRVNDHKREFFSRIKEMKCDNGKNMNTVQININFASHWHIPTFFLENAPVFEEIKWIKKILSFQNLPTSIRNIAELILKSITPNKDFTTDYKFFPVDRKTNQIPKKEIILLRDAIGRVIGYRFYRENFNFFNDFIHDLTSTTFKGDRYKNMELLCICISYEPYIYEKICNIMPDIKEKIEDFIDSIFFGLPNRNKLNLDLLYFDWSRNKTDLIHLFFIIYSNKVKLKQLNNEKLETILKFADLTFIKSDPSNYILYKLLRFFPLTNDEILNNKESLYLKETLHNFINSELINPKAKLEFTRFYSFLNTLPTADDLDFQIQKIRNVYWENDLPKNHDNREAYSINFSILISSMRELKDSQNFKVSLDKEKLTLVKDSWRNIKNILLNPIISFFRSYEDFFKPYPYLLFYNQFSGKEDSLINMYSFLEDFISNVEQKSNNIENYTKSISYIEHIDDKYGSESDEFRKLFENSSIMFSFFKENLFHGLNSLPNNVVISDINTDDFKINIPQKYFEKIILEEIINNLKFYSDEKEDINLSIIENDNLIVITIENRYLNIVKEFSSSEGINCLNNLSNSNLFNFNYEYNVNVKNKKFIQVLKFNKYGI